MKAIQHALTWAWVGKGAPFVGAALVLIAISVPLWFGFSIPLWNF